MPAEAPERRINYHERKESGHCPRCGVKKKKKYNYIYCEDCRTFFRNYSRENSEDVNKKRKINYDQRKKNKQCPRCGKKLGKKYTKTICQVCLEKQYEYNYN